jgi:hypothetical protein
MNFLVPLLRFKTVTPQIQADVLMKKCYIVSATDGNAHTNLSLEPSL